MTDLAKFISFITNPLFVLFPVPYFLIFKTSYDPLYAFKWTIFSMVFLLIAGVFMIYEVRRGVFTDLDVSKREQRPLLFAFLGVVTMFYLLSVMVLEGPPLLFFTTLGIMVGILLVSFINTKVKASIHVATITAVVITMGILYGVHVFTYMLVPVIAWSRVKAKRHTRTETLIGGVVGIMFTIGMYITLKYVFHVHV